MQLHEAGVSYGMQDGAILLLTTTLLASANKSLPVLKSSCCPCRAGLAPGLAFIGLPWRVVPFPMFELQARLCARCDTAGCERRCP
jgi:hypothetical protein